MTRDLTTANPRFFRSWIRAPLTTMASVLPVRIAPDLKGFGNLWQKPESFSPQAIAEFEIRA